MLFSHRIFFRLKTYFSLSTTRLSRVTVIRTLRLCLLLFVLTNSSCNIINPSEQIPAYIHLDSASVNIISAGQGSGSQEISDSWVYLHNQLQGVYEMPVTFPVLNEGTQEVVISAGIIENGVAATRKIYPFFYPDTFIVNLQPKETYTYHPTYKYRAATLFHFIQDFESGNNFEKVGCDTTMIRLDDSNVFEGGWCGYIKLDSAFVFSECKSSLTYPFTNNGNPVYLEMNYKCNQTFQVGVYSNTSSASVKFYQWNITTQTGWNKIYLNLTDVLATLAPNNYNILFKVEKDASVETSEVFLDNIKLITLQ